MIFKSQKQMAFWLMVFFILMNNIVCASENRKRFDKSPSASPDKVKNSARSMAMQLKQSIELSAEAKQDYFFTDIYNERETFLLPRLPIFQLIPELTLPSNIDGFIKSVSMIDLYFYFNVKSIRFVTIDEQGVTTSNSFFSKEKYQKLSVKVQPWGKSFEWTMINDVAAKHWKGEGKIPKIRSTDLPITFDRVYNRVILQRASSSSSNTQFIVFDLHDDDIDLSVRGLTFGFVVRLKLNELKEDKNRIGFNPSGLRFPQLHVPGELYPQSERDLFLTENFTPTELKFEDRVFLQPLICPTKENPFELLFTFKIAHLWDGKRTKIPILPNISTCVAHVACDKINETPGWSFENSSFQFGDYFYGIVIDFQNEKIALVNHQNVVEFHLTFVSGSKPTLELSNLPEEGSVKMHFSEYQGPAYISPAHTDSELTSPNKSEFQDTRMEHLSVSQSQFDPNMSSIQTTPLRKQNLFDENSERPSPRNTYFREHTETETEDESFAFGINQYRKD